MKVITRKNIKINEAKIMKPKGKANFIVSQFPLIALITFGIYPLITSILLLVRKDQFINKDYVLITGILGILLCGLLVPFIMGFFIE